MACRRYDRLFCDPDRNTRIYYRRATKWLARPVVRGDRRSCGPADRADSRSSGMEISFSEPYTFSWVRYFQTTAAAASRELAGRYRHHARRRGRRNLRLAHYDGFSALQDLGINRFLWH